MHKGYEQKILDHGYVRLIDWMGADETIIEAARMSTKGGFVSWDPYEGHPDGDAGLLEYLWENNHATPFEMCELAIEVQAPIMVFREWHRSRTQSYNEMSARYTVMPNLHYVPDPGRLIAQATKNKQAASVGDGEMDLDVALGFIVKEQETVYADYEEMIAKGVPKEVARINCPVSRYSKMRAKTDLRNWLHFLNLRMRPNAQWEIRQYANTVAEIIEELFPRTYWLFEEYTLHAQSFSRSEMKVLRTLFNEPVFKDSLANTAAAQDGATVKRVRKLLEKLSSSKA